MKEGYFYVNLICFIFLFLICLSLTFVPITTAQTLIAYGDSKYGTINGSRRDLYSFNADEDDVIVIRMCNTSGGLDPHLILSDSDGNQLEESYSIVESACAIHAILASGGTYIITADDHENNDSGSYKIYLESLNNPSNVEPIVYGETLSGNLELLEIDFYSFNADEGDRITIGATYAARIFLFDSKGTVLTYDDSRGAITKIEHKVESSGAYFIGLDNYRIYGKTGSYNVYLNCSNCPINSSSSTSSTTTTINESNSTTTIDQITTTTTTNDGIPDGFYQLSSAPGVILYKKDYPSGYPDYVQRVSLSEGASLKLLYGTITDPNTGEGVYGGDNPNFTCQILQQIWSEFSSSYDNGFSVTNGQFFSTNDCPSTRLAFPLKVDGTIVSDGYGINEYIDQKLMLELWTDYADIRPLTRTDLYNSSAPDILAGLSEDANKVPGNSIGRTFIGILDNDSDGYHEFVLIFNSKHSTQYHATQVLRDFGAAKIIMFDGGGSTQMICEDIEYISSNRLIPQSIAVLAATSTPITTTTSSTTTTSCKENDPCCTEEIYGDNSKETELLRYFRDNVLNKTSEGRELIRLYYQWSPAIVKAMDEDEDFKEQVKEMIDGVLPLIENTVK